MVGGARERGLPVLGELELAWRLHPQRVHRGDRHQRQDDDDRVDRPRPPRGGRCRSPWPATSAPPCRSLVGTPRARRDRRLRGLLVPARGHRPRSRPEAAVLLNLAPDHLDRHGTLRRLRRRQAAGRSPTRATTTSRSRPADLERRGPRRLRPPGARSATRPRRRARRPRRPPVVGRGAADPHATRSRCPARTTARTRWPPPRSASPAGSTPSAVADGLRTFAGVAHRLELIATQRRRRLRQRLQGDERREHDRRAALLRRRRPPDRSAAAASSRTSRRWRRSSASAAPAVYLIGEATRGARRRARARPACRSTTPATSSTRARRRARAPRARARSCCSRRRARASTSTRTSRRAASTSARSSGAADGRAPRRAPRSTAGAAAPARAARLDAVARAGRGQRVPPPLEHRILITATLCLLAFGAVMVYSASSPRGLLGGSGTGTGEFVRYLVFGGDRAWSRCTCSSAAAWRCSTAAS